MPPALSVEIKPSNYFRIALVCVALIALGAIFYADLVWSLRLLLVIFALAYSGYCCRKQLRQCGVLQWRSAWSWCGADGVERTLRLRHSTVWPGLIVLVFNDVERAENFGLMLFTDSFGADSSAASGLNTTGLGNDSARRLRVHLNHFPVFDCVETSE